MVLASPTSLITSIKTDARTHSRRACDKTIGKSSWSFFVGNLSRISDLLVPIKVVIRAFTTLSQVGISAHIIYAIALLKRGHLIRIFVFVSTVAVVVEFFSCRRPLVVKVCLLIVESVLLCFLHNPLSWLEIPFVTVCECLHLRIRLG